MINFDEKNYHLTDKWPHYSDIEKESNLEIAEFVKKIYLLGVFTEINRLLISREYPNCKGIGHIVLISICSAVDSLSAFVFGGGKVGNRFTGFISKYFPSKYLGKEQYIYESFRCDSVHGWNLHKSGITSMVNDPKHLFINNNIISISLYDFFNDFNKAFLKYYEELKVDDDIRDNFFKKI